MSDFEETGPINFTGLITVEKRRLLQEGDYLCTISSWRTLFMYGGHKLIIDCYIPDRDTTLSYICNIQISNEGIVKNPGRRSRLYKLLKSMSGRAHGQFNLEDLNGKECWARVVTSTKDERRNEKPSNEHYSIISALLPVETQEEEYPF